MRSILNARFVRFAIERAERSFGRVALTFVRRKRSRMDWIVNAATILAAVFAFGYLAYVMVRPERF